MGIIYAKQSTYALLPFHIRLDPLKLPRDPLKGLAGSPRDLLKILTNRSPDNALSVSQHCFKENKKSLWCHDRRLELIASLSLWVSLSVCLSLSLSHTHTRTHACMHARTHTRTHRESTYMYDFAVGLPLPAKLKVAVTICLKLSSMLWNGSLVDENWLTRTYFSTCLHIWGMQFLKSSVIPGLVQIYRYAVLKT